MDWLSWLPQAIGADPKKFFEGVTLVAIISSFLGALSF
jgi:hypothetical protein